MSLARRQEKESKFLFGHLSKREPPLRSFAMLSRESVCSESSCKRSFTGTLARPERKKQSGIDCVFSKENPRSRRSPHSRRRRTSLDKREALNEKRSALAGTFSLQSMSLRLALYQERRAWRPGEVFRATLEVIRGERELVESLFLLGGEH